MAHQFLIHKYKEGQKAKDVPTEEIAVFFGLCNGLMYASFGFEECNNGISGSGESKIISHKLMVKGCENAIYFFDRSGYPDPTRLDEIKEWFNKHKNDSKDTKYKIIFL